MKEKKEVNTKFDKINDILILIALIALFVAVVVGIVKCASLFNVVCLSITFVIVLWSYIRYKTWSVVNKFYYRIEPILKMIKNK